MRSASPVTAIPCWRNSAAAAVTIRSRVFAASILDFLIASHLLNGACVGNLQMTVDIYIIATYTLDVDRHLKELWEEITHEPGNNSFGHRPDRVHRRGNGRGVPGARAPRAGAGPPGGCPVEATPGAGG